MEDDIASRLRMIWKVQRVEVSALIIASAATVFVHASIIAAVMLLSAVALLISSVYEVWRLGAVAVTHQFNGKYLRNRARNTYRQYWRRDAYWYAVLGIAGIVLSVLLIVSWM